MRLFLLFSNTVLLVTKSIDKYLKRDFLQHSNKAFCLPFEIHEDTHLYPHKWSAQRFLYCATELSLIEHWSLLFTREKYNDPKLPFILDGENTIENISQKLYLFITWQIKEEIKSSLSTIAQIFSAHLLLRNVMVKSCLSQE